MENAEPFLICKNAKFCCLYCDFKCSKQSDWNRHIDTKKHLCRHSGNNMEKMEIKKNAEHICSCGKKYTSNSGLWKHKKTCKHFDKEEDTEIKEPEFNKDNFKITSKMFYDLLKQNNELQKSLIEMSKERGPVINSNNSNNNCNNKTFNLQVYLNETCKDAINLTDFVDSIKVQIKDLEKVGEKGYAEGISDIFINNLQQLNTHSRPIHCSDSKRETLYIKDENHWTKDDEHKTNLTKAIKQVANKNIKQISEWQKLHPKYKDPDSKQNDKYMQIVLNSMSGSTNEEATKNYEKIIKNVIKETIIDK
jgi:hypothetical protein